MKHVYEECDPEKLSVLFEVLDLTGNTQVGICVFTCYVAAPVIYLLCHL